MWGSNIAGYRDVVTGRMEAPREMAGAARISPVSSPELKSLLGITVAVVSITALYFASDVLIPIMLSVMLSFVLSPVVNLLQRLRLWRAPAVILTVLATLGVVVLIGTLIGSQAAALSTNAPEYARTIETKVEGVQGYAVKSIAAITRKLNLGNATPASGAGRAASPPPALTQPQAGQPPTAIGGRRPVMIFRITPTTITELKLRRRTQRPSSAWRDAVHSTA